MSGDTDTIVAPITPPGAGAVSVVRLSGPRVREVLPVIAERGEAALTYPRKAIFTPIRDLISGETLDHGLCIFFPNPNSFTGEDVLEVSLHGGAFILNRFLEGVVSLGVRVARPGEFSERAFHSGKLDLSQAEAVADLIAAETETQARVAREQLEGRLSQFISDLGEPLRDLLAEIEANIDFPEEGIDPLSYSHWAGVIAKIEGTLTECIGSYATGRICREGASVVIAGLPNAGKSSLLNRIVGENRAIVTPIPGTTRDSIEERLSIRGLSVRLWDTAGLAVDGYSPDEVEKIGIEQSWKRIREADLVLFLFDGTSSLSASEELLERIRGVAKKVICVANKSDAAGFSSEGAALSISAEHGSGVLGLTDRIHHELIGEATGSVMICSARHREALEHSKESLREALVAIENREPSEVIALCIRGGLSALSEIVGITTTDDILGRIFSKFCIGK